MGDFISVAFSRDWSYHDDDEVTLEEALYRTENFGVWPEKHPSRDKVGFTVRKIYDLEIVSFGRGTYYGYTVPQVIYRSKKWYQIHWRVTMQPTIEQAFEEACAWARSRQRAYDEEKELERLTNEARSSFLQERKILHQIEQELS